MQPVKTEKMTEKTASRELDAMTAEVATNFKRGTTEMLLLSLLTVREYYVYELSKALREISKGLFDLQGPSFYTTLYRLQDKGLVSCRTETVGRRTRVYYRVLPKGGEYLKRIIALYRQTSEGVERVLSETGQLPKTDPPGSDQ